MYISEGLPLTIATDALRSVMGRGLCRVFFTRWIILTSFRQPFTEHKHPFCIQSYKHVHTLGPEKSEWADYAVQA